VTISATIAGRQRSVVVHTPGSAGGQRLPLVLNLHGSESTALQQQQFSGMDAAADADRFIVAYPQALIPAGAGFDWNVPGVPVIGGRSAPASAPNDVAFLTQLVPILQQRYCVDPARVYATGFSGGARMASQLACDASGTFAAVAPVSGLRRPSPCPATRAVPIIAFHGTSDPIDPYGGHGQAYWTYSVSQAVSDWARMQRCSTPVTRSQAGFRLTVASGCAGGSRIELYSIIGAGHEWPGGPKVPAAIRRLLGPQSTAVNANAVMWAFLRAHPLR
jgi:polyhydroxybutyrate depolymerase